MQMSLTTEKDILIMKLLNYFITKRNYSPIIIHGIDNEIWLENPNEEFRIIRIVTRNIFNNEQATFDYRKTKHIIKQLKRKMFTLKISSLSIYTETGDIDTIPNDKDYKTIVVKKEEDVYKQAILESYYPDIKQNLIYTEEGFELITKITTNISKKNIEESERRKNMFKRNVPYITYILITINIIIFCLMYTFGGGSEDTNTLINFGANYIPLVKAGQYYRLITSGFLHIGVLHLLCNMYSLYVIGKEIEQFYGKAKYILIYFFSMIVGSLFTIIFSSENTVSAGASGAIFGLLSSILYFGYHYRGYIGNAIIGQIMPVLIINLFITFTTPGIGAAAHIGGLIGGYTISYALGADLDEDRTQHITGYIITFILTAFLVYMSFFK